MRRLVPAILAFVALSIVPAFAQSRTVTLITLEWPPYTSAALKDSGASVAVATAAFRAMGYTLKVEFYPWERAVLLAKTDPKYAGYFPEYWSDDNAKEFVYSDPAGTGPLGFVERKDSPLSWSALSDLKAKSIGVVSGYINTTDFDAMVASKQLTVQAADDDITNVRKVLARRVQTAVIDANVLRFLVATDPSLAANKGELQFNAKSLELKKLYVCFKKGPDGERLAQVFNDGLKKIDVDKIMKDYFSAAFGK